MIYEGGVVGVGINVVVGEGTGIGSSGTAEGIVRRRKNAALPRTKNRTMSTRTIVFYFTILSVVTLAAVFLPKKQEEPAAASAYWFLLQRKSNRELLYYGVPGNGKESTLIKTFLVKTGIPGQRPTPLPQLVGRSFWRITKKEKTDNPETAPYFLTLDIPAPTDAPYGPSPYTECNGQCDWVQPGAFGLHGVGGDPTRLFSGDPGSSGCIRHTDGDISYLYDLLTPEKGEIRFYVQDV